MTAAPPFERYARFVARRGPAVAALLALLTGAGVWLLPRLQVDADIAELLPRDSQTRRLIDKYATPGAASELLLIGVSHPELLAPARLAQVAQIDRRIRAQPEVQSSLTPFNLRTFRKQEGRLLLAPLAAGGTAPAGAAEAARWQSRLAAAPPEATALFNPEVPALNLIYSVATQEDYGPFLQRVRAVLAAHGEELSAVLGGWLPLYEASRGAIAGELPLLAGAAAAITLLVYLLSFATLRAVVLPLLAIAAGLLWTFGLMALTGVPVSMASLMLPPLIFALGSSYGIHFLHRYFSAAPAAAQAAADSGGRIGSAPPARVAAVAQVSGAAAQTIVLASLTTAAGFASLLFSGMPRLREFGLFAGAGIINCAVVTLLLYPAVLARLPLPDRRRRERLTRGALARFVDRVTALVPRRRWWVYGFLVLLAAALAATATGLRYQTDVAAFFRGSVAAVEDNRLLMRRFGSYVDLNLTVTAPAGVPDAELLEQLARFEAAARGHPNVSHVTTPVAYLRSLNHALTGNPDYPRNPVVVHLFQRLLRLAAAGGNDLGGLVDADRGRVTTRIWIRNGDTRWLLSEREMRELVQFLRGRAAAVFPARLEPELWGWSLVTLRVAEILTREQLVSTAAAALLVLLITSLAFRSLRYGLLTLLPLGTSIMLTFILMALFGIPLDVLTVSFAGVAIGVGVDDSIHFLLHYRRARASRGARGGGLGRRRTAPEAAAPEAAVAATMQHTGRAILITTAAIVAGLLALGVSRFLPVVYLGALICITLIGATFGTLVLLPALLLGDNPRKAPAPTAPAAERAAGAVGRERALPRRPPDEEPA